jgi:hypothetical protein
MRALPTPTFQGWLMQLDEDAASEEAGRDAMQMQEVRRMEVI